MRDNADQFGPFCFSYLPPSLSDLTPLSCLLSPQVLSFPFVYPFLLPMTSPHALGRCQIASLGRNVKASLNGKSVNGQIFYFYFCLCCFVNDETQRRDLLPIGLVCRGIIRTQSWTRAFQLAPRNGNALCRALLVNRRVQAPLQVCPLPLVAHYRNESCAMNSRLRIRLRLSSNFNFSNTVAMEH